MKWGEPPLISQAKCKKRAISNEHAHCARMLSTKLNQAIVFISKSFMHCYVLTCIETVSVSGIIDDWRPRGLRRPWSESCSGGCGCSSDNGGSGSLGRVSNHCGEEGVLASVLPI